MGILLDARKLKAYDFLKQLCDYAGKTPEWADELWKDLLINTEIYDEFMYYLDNHTFKDEYRIGGYSMSDLYVWQMDKYNIIREIGKNPTSCNKETMVLNAFRTMIDMKADPEPFIKRLESGWGNDRL